MKPVTTGWLYPIGNMYCERGQSVVCAKIIRRWFAIPGVSQIQLRLSRERQNEDSRKVRFQCTSGFLGWWHYKPRRDYPGDALCKIADRAIAKFFPNAAHGDTHYLYLTCWYREATP